MYNIVCSILFSYWAYPSALWDCRLKFPIQCSQKMPVMPRVFFRKNISFLIYILPTLSVLFAYVLSAFSLITACLDE